ncbi:uncharacterized protein A1O9_01249 [Exophiala aquamarina CBS 119918]|uniref:Aminoacyl-transfer RNA synthetases class-II family profile domain-containing protein n=1 Tax=Exophiala aquamarina CBS 119918 TaxID=1182545 RepID=A0A072PU88_9EURO|nr:uncharacterized protein A1O9_01249 [Exophiala aquamarina CBS 119918]KEF63272.1 hypothetical protein A1O9_01249 [Exophiala aquamarina CBS 119918]
MTHLFKTWKDGEEEKKRRGVGEKKLHFVRRAQGVAGKTSVHGSDIRESRAADIEYHIVRNSIYKALRNQQNKFYLLVKASYDQNGFYAREVQLCGYLTSQRPGRQVNFLQLVDPDLKLAIQVVATTPGSETNDATTGSLSNEPKVSTSGQKMGLLDDIKNIKSHTPVIITGKAIKRYAPPKANADKSESDSSTNNRRDHEVPSVQKALKGKAPPNTIPVFDPFVGTVELISHLEVQATSVRQLNEVPRDLIATADTAFPPEQRYLQFRTDRELRQRLQYRARVASFCRSHLAALQFQEVETPLLFKSTPEGAREFIIPTRQKGLAYALPQSPQQYKQVLMASGVSRYFQFAKCFRDEDLRADRQPEFTQLDLEMSFTTSVGVMDRVTKLLKAIFKVFSLPLQIMPHPIKYKTAMASYGSDKPDVRFNSIIYRANGWFSSSVIRRLSSLEDPYVDAMKVEMEGTSPDEAGAFVRSFLDSPTSSAFISNPAGMPGVAVYDPSKPLRGLASFEHEGAAQIEDVLKPKPGDIIIVQTRPQGRLRGGSTPLGNIRRDIHAAAVKQGLVKAPDGFALLWVVDFPLFSPLEGSDPGQGGKAEFCSTHHPFTAPKPRQDLPRLITDPLSIIGDHYDLVINGVEVGGGSRRIHTADMQELVLRDVLKMKPERIEDFRHLLNALGSGCPPHAGFALGFDRLIALMTGTQSVRDVIAFPKTADGQDKFAGTPSPLTADQLATYHLKPA